MLIVSADTFTIMNHAGLGLRLERLHLLDLRPAALIKEIHGA
jgi:hypothetical protein